MNTRITRLAIYGLVFMTLLGVIGCSPELLDEQELKAYIQETSHGLMKEQVQGDLKVKVTYRPTDLLIAQELGREYDLEQVTALRNKYEPYAYFMVHMEAGKRDALYGTSSSQGDFSSKLQTLSFKMSKYVNVTTSGQDTIPVADYAFPRTFGMAKGTDLLFVFNKEEMKDKEWISFNLNEFGFRTGDQRFRFKWSDINEIPKIKFPKSNV